MKKSLFVISVLIAVVIAATFACHDKDKNKPTEDEAKAKGWTADKIPEADEDYFKDMDGKIALTPDEVKGRNTWIVYTAGNDAFWNYLATKSVGTVDLLKILSSYPKGNYGRYNRFSYFGMMNEPGFKQATKQDPYGLWLDERTEAPDPFENEQKYPGVNGGSFYGKASGVVGLRLFPNPDFNDEAKKNWDPVRYYNDTNYYYNPKLVRPYRVAMSCGFCHVGPSPLSPPQDPENPKWENLSSNIGAQYFWAGRIFGYDLGPRNFLWQLFNSAPPGTVETSQISSDNINNPRTMNAIYSVGARLGAANGYPKEEVPANTMNLFGITHKTNTVPHILKDGADAIGIQGALARVYFNIGSYHTEWIKHFNPIFGGKPETPMDVKYANENSVYFQATSKFVGNLAKFFLKAAVPQHLKDAPGGADYLTKDSALLKKGKLVFADNCAPCHSSKQPSPQIDMNTQPYKDWMRAEVVKPDFLDNNYMSDEKRHPVSVIGTNASASLATNAIRGHVWDNFSSETYKNLPSVGTIKVRYPLGDSEYDYQMPAGGRGYYRTPSLISVWATAPFFHNNGLGKFTNDPSVKGRMEAFDDAIEKLLWPDKRSEASNADWNMPWSSSMWRTTEESYIVIHKDFLPAALTALLDKGTDEVKIGPIPKGTPVNLLANIDVELKFGLDQLKKHKELAALLIDIKNSLWQIKVQHLNSEQSTELLKKLVPELLSVSKCPDFVEDRGHLFGTQLPDGDKKALIEFIKTL